MTRDPTAQRSLRERFLLGDLGRGPRLLAVAALLLAPLEVSAQELVRSPTREASPEAFADFVAAALGEAGAKGWGLTLIRGGQVAVQRYGGTAGQLDQPVTPATVFSAESNAKPVIAWAVMRLVEQGLIELDSPLEASLKSFRLPSSEFDHNGITIRRVLTHTSGLSWGRLKDFPEGQSLPSVAELFSQEDSLGQRLEVETEPGTRVNYSSGGYALLQLLVEDVTGRPFSDFVRDEVLTPLGMWNTGFSPSWTAVPSYDGFGREGRSVHDATANDLRTSLPDFTAFALAHFDRQGHPTGGGVLQPKTVSAMVTPSAEAGGRRGLGYSVTVTERGIVVAGHDGGGSMFRVSTETGEGLVLLSNSDAYMLVPRIECAWERWSYGLEGPCPVPAAHVLYGAYQSGGVARAIERYDRIQRDSGTDYAVGETQLALFAHLLVGAGLHSDGATIFRKLAESPTTRSGAYAEVAAALDAGESLDPSFFPCYAGEFRSPAGAVVTLRLRERDLILEVEDLPWQNSVRALSRRLFAYDPLGSDGDTPGQLVFELDDAGVASSLSLSDPDLDLELSASRVSPASGCSAQPAHEGRG